MPKKPVGLFDIPVEIACPDCGNGIQVKLARLQDRANNLICTSCTHHIHLSQEQATRLIDEHGKKLAALRRAFSDR